MPTRMREAPSAASRSRTGVGALTRAVLEGVAFALRDCLDVVRDVGAATARGRVSGGGSRSRLWLQIVASALEIPLEMMATDQGSAFGAALLGGVAVGCVSRPRARRRDACVRVNEVIEPVAAWIEPYREARRRFRDYYPALRSVELTGAGSGRSALRGPGRYQRRLVEHASQREFGGAEQGVRRRRAGSVG